MPIASEEARIETIATAKAAEDKKPDAERIRLSWKLGEQVATVVEIPLTAVVLNPRSHRIRAQLESHPAKELVERQPFTDSAQEVISELLRKTADFEDLKNNLKDVGQTDPGVITHSGLLVNANTRCVALRDLGRRYIRVAVLDEDAPDEEINRLELRLQMKRDFRREYTFTNELLFIEELVKKYKYKPTEIALEMGWASKSDVAGLKRETERVHHSLRMLTIIRETQELSGWRLPLTFFDSDRQAILELEEDYERLKKRAPADAAKLRDTRLVALLAGAGYRELRQINESFLDDYLAPALEEQPSFRGKVDRVLEAPVVAPGDPLPGLDVLDVPEDGGRPTGRTAAPLLSALAESAGRQRVVIEGSSGPIVEAPRGGFLDELRKAVETGAADAKIDRDQGDLLGRPLASVRKAAKHLSVAGEAYQAAKGAPGFDRPALRRALEDLGRAQQALLRTLMDDEGS